MSATSLRTRWVWASLFSCASLSCASQKVEPQVASSAVQANYARDYPALLQATANDFVNNENDVRRITTEFPKYPDQLKDPPWPLVDNVVSRADEAGRSASYVEARRELDGTLAFFTAERDELTRRVSGSAQYLIKKKECEVDVSGAVSSSLKEGVEKQIEKRLRAHDDAHLLIERYRESLGRANATALEKQADDISLASYAVYIRSVELKARASRLLDETSQVKTTIERNVADERAFQAEPGRTAADKKTSNERIAKMEDAKVRIGAGTPQIQALSNEIDQRNSAIKKEYEGALSLLKKAIAAKSASK